MARNNGENIGRGNKWLSSIFYLILYLIWAVIFISLLIQFSSVQNWVADRITKKISKDLETEITVGDVAFSLSKGFVLEDLYVKNNVGDTLLYVGAASTTITQNLISLYDNQLYLDKIHLDDVTVRNHTLEGESSTLAAYFGMFGGSSKSDEGGGKPFLLGVEEVNLNRFSFSDINDNNGKEFSLNVNQGIILVDTIDFSNKHFSFDLIKFDGPEVEMLVEQRSSTVKLDEETEENVELIQENIPQTKDTAVNVSLIEIKEFKIIDGGFKMDDNRREDRNFDFNAIDYGHFGVTQINTVTKDLQLVNGQRILAQIESFSLKENNGFDIQKLSVGDLYMDDTKVELNSLYFKTANTEIKDQLSFRFSDFGAFNSFEKEVSIRANFEESNISVHDLVYFFPKLYNTSFFKQNYDRQFFLSGKLRGTANNLRASNLKLSIDDLLKYEGRFSMRNLVDIENATISFSIEELSTSIQNLKTIIPEFRPPSNYNLLGNIDYKGRFVGSFFDFVSFGQLNTSLGKVDTDLRMDIKNGMENARYSGILNLIDFDLGKWSKNDEFGLVSFDAEIKNGKGLRLENAFADLEADLNEFTFKGHTYQNVSFDGKMDAKTFVGKLNIDEPSVKLDFDGDLDFSQDVIVSDFKASIEKLNLKELNLVKEDLELNGDFDVALVGTGIGDFVGEAEVIDLNIVKQGTAYHFDSISVESSPLAKEGRSVMLRSDFINADVAGVFNLDDIDDQVFDYFHRYHPKWAQKLKIARPKKLENNQHFDFSFDIQDSKNYFDLLGVSDLKVKAAKVSGAIDLVSDVLDAKVEVAEIQMKDLGINTIALDIENEKYNGRYEMQIDSLHALGRSFTPIEFITNISTDDVHINLNTENILDSIGNIELMVDLVPVDDGFDMHLSQNEWQMMGKDWKFSPNNKVFIGDKTIEIEDMVLTDGDRSISIEDVNGKGVIMEVNDFDFIIINQLINYDKIDFTGRCNLIVENSNIFENGNFDADFSMPSLQLNGDDYGQLKVIASSLEDKGVGIVMRLFRPDDLQDIKVEGIYNLDTKEIDAELTASKFDLRLFEYIIEDGISDTKGYAEVDARLTGKIEDPNLYGEATLHEGGTRINYLGSYLSFDKQRLSLTERYVNLNGIQITDRLGNVGTFTGGLNHYFLGDFSIDLAVSSNNFLALDTDKSDNPLYYGQGIGRMNIDISGTFDSPNFVVNAETRAGANLNIPIESTQSDYDESYIKFVSRDVMIKSQEDSIKVETAEIEGVNFELNLTVTPEAQFNIIFDERLNDIIKGKGRGNIRVNINRKGDFEVFGDYEVESGEYLFTALGIVAKPFTVKRGGRITWTGDPFNANLNIEAYYEGLRAPLNIFLAEYLDFGAQTAAAQEAKTRTDVDLTMQITGLLFEPNVSFDMQFPEVVGEIKSYTDSKMRTLRQNESELNDQVAGLILFGSFLPSNNALGSNLVSAGSLNSGIYNTLSEMIGNQLSFLLSGILSEAFNENGFISGIDFDIGFNKNSEFDQKAIANSGFVPDEVEIQLKPKFQNDRWGLNVGTNYVRQSGVGTGTLNNYVVNDVVLEYMLTKDRRLKMRAYAKNDFDVFVNQREQQFGIGINYRKEFGSLTDLVDELKADVSKTFKARIPEETEK